MATKEKIEDKIKNIKFDLNKIGELFKAGWTDEQIAVFLGISRMTLHRWFNDNEELLHLKRNWKIMADEKVERSLYESACGYTVVNEKAVVVSDGKDIGSHVEMVTETIQYPPNSTSCIFWLKNRKPKQWRDRVEVDGSMKHYLSEELKDKSEEELEKEATQLANEIISRGQRIKTN